MQHGSEVDFSVAEHQVIVHTTAHIFDVDVPEDVLPTPHMVVDRRLSLAMQMSHVECEAEVRTRYSFLKFRKSVHGIDEHSRFRLEREANLKLCGAIAQATHAFHEPVHQHLRRRPVRGRTRPQADRVRFSAGDLNGTTQKINSRLAGLLIGAQKRWLMFMPWIEQETCPVSMTERRPRWRRFERSRAVAATRSKGLSRVMVERESDAFIAQVEQG